MIVVDASVLTVALADDGDDGRRTRQRLRRERLAAPHLIDLEVVSAWRGLAAAGRLSPQRVALALTDLQDLPIRRAPHEPLIARCWELRDNLSAYDASYVALAEALDAPLLTADKRLASAPGIRCQVEVIR